MFVAVDSFNLSDKLFGNEVITSEMTVQRRSINQYSFIKRGRQNATTNNKKYTICGKIYTLCLRKSSHL